MFELNERCLYKRHWNYPCENVPVNKVEEQHVEEACTRQDVAHKYNLDRWFASVGTVSNLREAQCWENPPKSAEIPRILEKEQWKYGIELSLFCDPIYSKSKEKCTEQVLEAPPQGLYRCQHCRLLCFARLCIHIHVNKQRKYEIPFGAMTHKVVQCQ